MGEIKTERNEWITKEIVKKKQKRRQWSRGSTGRRRRRVESVRVTWSDQIVLVWVENSFKSLLAGSSFPGLGLEERKTVTK